jgi:hypothetical protein
VAILDLTTGGPFPALPWQPVYTQYALHRAWFSGSSERLANTYASYLQGYGLPFYERVAAKERAALVHVPVAGDIARLSASLLFSEEPSIAVLGSDSAETMPTPIQAASDRLGVLLAQNGVVRRFREAAESCAAMGGVLWKINIDRTVQPDAPILSIAQADAAYPEFRHGRLVRCTFWTVEDESKDSYTRLLETYEPGRVTTQRYRGSVGVLGASVGDVEVVETRVPELLCGYVPNMLPNRMFANGVGMHLGQSDLSGLEGLMDSLDEIYTDWLRDIQLAKHRILGDKTMFERSTDGTTRFNLDTQVYEGLDSVSNAALSLSDQLTMTNFAIRSEDHARTFTSTLRTIYAMAGYAFTASGMEESGQVESGKALKVRDRKSFVTRNDKSGYWEEGLQQACYRLLQVDATQFSGPAPQPVEVELSDSVDPDPLEQAQTIELLNRAQAASVDTLVAMLHPKWSALKRAEEVQRLQEARGVLTDPLQGGLLP